MKETNVTIYLNTFLSTRDTKSLRPLIGKGRCNSGHFRHALWLNNLSIYCSYSLICLAIDCKDNLNAHRYFQLALSNNPYNCWLWKLVRYKRYFFYYYAKLCVDTNLHPSSFIILLFSLSSTNFLLVTHCLPHFQLTLAYAIYYFSSSLFLNSSWLYFSYCFCSIT